MLIPSIDLMDGRVVQLEQGERLVLESDDLDGWIERFAPYPIVQVIDLDAAMGRGSNLPIVERICHTRPCQVGGGVRTPDRGRALLDAGAKHVIVGSALFAKGGVDETAAALFAQSIPPEQLIAAIDARGGQVVINGWKTALPVTPSQAAQALEPFVGAFLYTHVDTEGLLGGINMDAVLTVASATTRRLIAAGGIRSQKEIDRLDARGIDSVVGMAIYRGMMT